MELTDEQLHAIDCAVAHRSDAPPTQCAVTLPLDIPLDMAAMGFTAYADLPDHRSRSPYERSRWLRLDNGRCVPELYVRATVVYGMLTQDQQPYWKDRNWGNRADANIGVFSLKPKSVNAFKPGKYGVRSNTPEYRKAYYSDPENRERLRVQGRESARKSRDQLRAAREVLSDPNAADPAARLEELRRRILGDED